MTIEETVIDLLQKEGYELIADDDFWVVNRKYLILLMMNYYYLN